MPYANCVVCCRLTAMGPVPVPGGRALLLVALALALALAAGWPQGAQAAQAGQDATCQPDKLTVYKVVMHTFWSRDRFPKHYPDWRPPAQWSKVIGE